MHKLSIIQYLPLTRPKATMRFIKKLDMASVMSILDLEDSAQDPFDLEETSKLKDDARNGLVIISEGCTWPVSSKIYVRLNATGSQYFEEDIKAILIACENTMPISGVFLPKVEDYSQIEQTARCLSISTRPLEIVPMIETVKGMNNLSKILQADKGAQNSLFNRVHYGHFDYCLDAQLWPFSDPCHSSFWEIIKPMVSELLKYNKTYVHTPFPFPKNEKLFWASSFYLTSLFPTLDAWICTLNSELSLSYQPEELTALDFVEADCTKNNLIIAAQNICDDFHNGRANKRSFGVSHERFIPPHQYFAAKNYLKSLEVYDAG